MIQQGVALMIAGIVTVYFFLWLLVVSIQISERVIRLISVKFSKSSPDSLKPEIIAAISTIIYNQQDSKEK